MGRLLLSESGVLAARAGSLVSPDIGRYPVFPVAADCNNSDWDAGASCIKIMTSLNQNFVCAFGNGIALRIVSVVKAVIHFSSGIVEPVCAVRPFIF